MQRTLHRARACWKKERPEAAHSSLPDDAVRERVEDLQMLLDNVGIKF